MPQWATVTAMPVVRAGHASAAAGGKVYVAGGRSTSNAAAATAHVYDLDTDAWTALPNMPSVRSDCRGAVDAQGRFYVVGGSASGGGASNNLYRYDPGTSAWSTMQALPTARSNHAAVADSQGRIYVAGGADGSGNALTSVHRYDPATNAWTTLASNASNRNGGVLLADANDRIWFLGGWDASGNAILTMEVYDPGSNSWAANVNGSTSPHCAPAAWTDEQGRLVLAGGCAALNTTAATTVVERFSITTGAWTTLEALPTAVVVAAAGRVGRRVIVTGGGTTRTSAPVATAQRYTGNNPPNVGGKPAPDGQNLDRTADQAFSYAFSDQDAGDTPSRTDWRWRTSPSSGTPGSWNTATVNGTSTSLTYPAGTFPLGRVELQVLPYDSQGVVAPAWSDSAFDTMVEPPTAVTFASPAAGSTIASSTVTATITTTNLDALGWEVRGDTGGTANGTLIASGTIEDSTARAFTATGLPNGTTVHLRARRRVNGLWSPWTDNGAQLVSFTPPPLPALTLTYDSTRGSATEGTMLVAWAIPAPAGSEPTVVAVDIALDHGDADGMHRVAAALPPGAGSGGALAGSWRYWSPVPQRDYGSGSARVRVTAIGANGATRTATT